MHLLKMIYFTCFRSKDRATEFRIHSGRFNKIEKSDVVITSSCENVIQQLHEWNVEAHFKGVIVVASGGSCHLQIIRIL